MEQLASNTANFFEKRSIGEIDCLLGEEDGI
jgi:hypothetical protein